MCKTSKWSSERESTGTERKSQDVGRRGCIFSLLFFPPFLHISLISHPSIFHFYTQLQMWREWNIKLPKWACFCTLATSKTTKPLLFPDPKHTHAHIHIHTYSHFLMMCENEYHLLGVTETKWCMFLGQWVCLSFFNVASVNLVLFLDLKLQFFVQQAIQSCFC